MATGDRSTALQLLTIEEFTAARRPVTLLSATGRVTAHDLPRLFDQLLVHIRHGRRHLLLDLTEADVATDEMAGMLHEVRCGAQLHGCSFGVVGVAADLSSSPRFGLEGGLACYASLSRPQHAKRRRPRVITRPQCDVLRVGRRGPVTLGKQAI